MTEFENLSIGEQLPDQTNVPNCFGCGLENPSGLKLKFKKESATSISTQFIAPEDWTGFRKILHGGFQSLLLDEITAWIAFIITDRHNILTKEITFRFHKPAYVGTPLTISARLIEDTGREIHVYGEIKDYRDCLLTEASATLIRIQQETLEALGYPDSG